MKGYAWRARSPHTRSFLRVTLLALLLLFGLPLLPSGSAWVFGSSPRSVLIDGREPSGQHAPTRSPHVASPHMQQPRGPTFSADIRGIITSVTTEYLRRVLRLAEAADANALIIQMSASGGVLRDLRPFAGEIAKAHVPVVVYVTPAGTQAGAAGALFLSAAHISVLAPRTSFGSPYPLTQVDTLLLQQTRDLVLDSVADQLRSWNAARGRNTDWVDRAVREGVVLTNEQAFAAHPPAVDLVAADQDELLMLLEGRAVKLADGRNVQLTTLGQSVTPVEPTIWEGLRLALANPTIAFILLALGALAIYLELGAPGTSIFAGIGVVLLTGSVAGLLVLPIHVWSLLLLVLGFVLIGVEFFAPIHGALVVTGLALVLVGALNLIDPVQAPGAKIDPWIVPVAVLVLGALAACIVWAAVRNRWRPVLTGIEALIGRVGVATSDLAPQGTVRLDGESWSAVADVEPIHAGEQVQIVAVEGVILWVQPFEGELPGVIGQGGM
jgi:membrane-bound serine protease (ClpP class)